MDEVRTSIEKIIDSFESDNIKTDAKRLSYSFLSSSGGKKSSNDSPYSPSLKRRRRADDVDDDDEVSFSYSNISGNSTLNSSNQWEVRILKADLIEANTKVLQLKKEVEDRVHLHKNLEQLYDGKIKNTQAQLDAAVSKNEEYEKMVKFMRKKCAVDKENLVKMKNEMAKQKHGFEEIITSLRNTNRDVENNAREVIHSLNTQMSSLNLEIAQARLTIDAMQDEINTLRTRNDELSENLKSTNSLSSQLETQRYQLETAQRKIKDLEAELASHGEWKNLSKVFQARLAKVTDLERENERLTRDYKNLHETIGNKLLLEEQVHDLKSRLDLQSRSSDTNVDLDTKLRSIQQELKLWKKMAEEFCPSESLPNPLALRTYISKIQKEHVILASNAGTATLEKCAVTDQVYELKKQNELQTKANETMSNNLRNYKNALHRMQKKLALIAKERDCFKTLLENYEKDLTMTAPSYDGIVDIELKSRIEVLERSLAGYKDICSTLEKELEVSQSTGIELNGNLGTNNEQNEHLRKELEKIRNENERLQRRKDELEMILEQIKMKEAYNIGCNGKELKVVHMTMNPADEAADNYKNEMDKLRAEIERLRRKIRKMEDEHQDLTTKLNESTSAANTTVNIQEVNALKSRIQSLESKQQHYKDIYRAASLEFREVIYLLFGYKVDRVGNNNYRISSVYAESEDEYLNFRLNDGGELDMLETEYSLTLADMVGNYLAAHHSMPAFLSSLTLDLFNRQTVAVR